jgi:hypothetical protein
MNSPFFSLTHERAMHYALDLTNLREQKIVVLELATVLPLLESERIILSDAFAARVARRLARFNSAEESAKSKVYAVSHVLQ